MKFDYCLGNPPYQEQKGGTKNIDIWPDFVKETSKIANTRCLIHPGRWVVPTASRIGMQENILNDCLQAFDYYANSADVFPNTCIGGGISITLFNKNYSGDIHVSFNGKDTKIYNPNEKFLKNKYEVEIYNKVFNNITLNMLPYIKGNIGTLGSSDRFNYLDEESQATLQLNKDNLIEPIRVWATKTSGKGGANYQWYWIDKSNIKNIADYQFKTRKVMLDKKGHPISEGKGAVIANLPQICEKFTYGVNVLWVIPKNDTERELQLIKSLFMTKTARYLMCITQNSVCVRGFENIPDYLELAKLLPEDQLFSDEWFYKTFDFSKELINDIETRVSEKVEK